MRKKRKICILLLAVCSVLCCILAFAACGKPSVSTPTGLSVDESTLLLSWSEVENAKSYKIDFGETQVESRKNSYSLTELEVGDYEIRIMAVSGMEDYADSGWSEPINFTREYENGLTYRMVEDNTAYEVAGIGTASGDVVMVSTYRGKPVVGIGEKAFYNTSKLRSIVIADSVTSIGARAFANCSQLTSVTFGSGVVTIGEYAFQSCRAMTELVVPGTVKTIGEYAFSYCRGLTGLTLGYGVEELGGYAFDECTSLTGVEIPSSVSTIGEYCFYNTTALERAEMGKTAAEDEFSRLAVGEYAFSNSTLSSLILGDGVGEIGAYAFSNCSSLLAVDLTDSVVTIGEAAFWNDTALTEVSLGNGLTEIGRYAFLASGVWLNASDLVYADKWLVGNKNLSLTTVTIREDTVGISCWAFYGSNSITKIVIPDGVKLINPNAFYGMSSLIAVTVGNGVEVIGDSAFYRCALLTSISLGDHLQNIGSRAFANCSRLQSVTIPASVNRIGSGAFTGTALWENADDGVVYADTWAVGWKETTSEDEEEDEEEEEVTIKSITLRAGTVGIAEYCFYGCDASSISMPDSVLYLGRCAFYHLSWLMMVRLSDNITKIEEYTFYRCGFLFSVNLPSGVTSIGRSAFFRCGSVFGITLSLPDTLTTIDDYAFYGSGVIFTRISQNLTYIGDKAFSNCENLQEFDLPDSVTYIGERAFYACINLQSITLGNNLEYIGDRAFYKCTSLTEITIPDSVTYLGSYAFYKCTALESVSIGSGVTSVPDYAFFGCTELKYLYLPETITQIGVQSFRGCSFTGVVLAANLLTMGKHAFYSCKNATFYVEAESAPEGWNSVWNSSYRTVVWGATLSEDKSYVVSVVAGNLTNPDASGGVTAPVRAGYTFLGWTTEENGMVAEYSAAELPAVEEGVVLYAVWQEGEPEEPDESDGEEPSADND